MFSVLLQAHQVILADKKEPFTDTDNDTHVAANTVDVRALDDLIIDFPEPDPEQLQLPAWKTWLIRAADTMYWTVQTSKEAVMIAYDRCKRLISSDDDKKDEVSS